MLGASEWSAECYLVVSISMISLQTLQSVICEPAHDERLELTDMVRHGKYTVKGLAYNGGGERIERVELSVDGGKTWRYCFRHFVEKPLRCVLSVSPVANIILTRFTLQFTIGTQINGGHGSSGMSYRFRAEQNAFMSYI